MFDLSAIHRPVLAFSQTVHGNFGFQHTLFQGRPVYSHSIFVDGAGSTLFPQMDVCPRCHCVGFAER